MERITHRIVGKDGVLIAFCVNEAEKSIKECANYLEEGRILIIYNINTKTEYPVGVMDFERLISDPAGSHENNFDKTLVWTQKDDKDESKQS